MTPEKIASAAALVQDAIGKYQKLQKTVGQWAINYRLFCTYWALFSNKIQWVVKNVFLFKQGS